MNRKERDQRLKLLTDAQDLLHDACTKIEQAVDGTSFEKPAHLYILTGLKGWQDGQHTNNYMTIPFLIEKILQE